MYCGTASHPFFSPDDNPTGPLCRESSSSINYICLYLSFFFTYITTFLSISFDLSSFFFLYDSHQLFYIMCRCLKRHRPTLTSNLSPGWRGGGDILS